MAVDLAPLCAEIQHVVQAWQARHTCHGSAAALQRCSPAYKSAQLQARTATFLRVEFDVAWFLMTDVVFMELERCLNW